MAAQEAARLEEEAAIREAEAAQREEADSALQKLSRLYSCQKQYVTSVSLLHCCFSRVISFHFCIVDEQQRNVIEARFLLLKFCKLLAV